MNIVIIFRKFFRQYISITLKYFDEYNLFHCLGFFFNIIKDNKIIFSIKIKNSKNIYSCKDTSLQNINR